ncbi:reverse transcriptase domain-containing protein [Tanacetum coccineum]
MAIFSYEKPETDIVLILHSEFQPPKPRILFTEAIFIKRGRGYWPWALSLPTPEGRISHDRAQMHRHVLPCVGPIHADYVLRRDPCGFNGSMHIRPRSVVARSLNGLVLLAYTHNHSPPKRRLDSAYERFQKIISMLELYDAKRTTWIRGKWTVAKEDNMVQYLDKTKSLIQGFDRFTIRQVPRGDNKKADALSKIASTSFAHLSKQVLVEILKNKSISEMDISTVLEEQDPTWMTPIVEFISKGTLPHEQKDARRIRRTAQRFELRDGVLYRRSFLQPWLRCVGPIQADYVLREIRAGSCSMHSGPRSVVARALRSGYYWPTMHYDARDMIKKCKDCQVPITTGANTYHLTMAIPQVGYRHRWPLPRCSGRIEIPRRFVWDNIVCRFGLPGEIVSDNGKQFCDNPFKDWCSRLSITQRFASVKHPQTNGLVERANRSLGEGIKARLDRHKGRWVEELSHVLWAHRTTIKVSTGDTPFSLVYGTEAVIPAEIGMPTIRTAEVNITTNDDERRIDLDILEERREQAAIREEKAKLKMKGYYDAKVRGVSFRPGDFVYRANDASHAEDTGKLGPKWEGPYEVTEALGKGAYKLRDMDGRELPRTWNICNLKKCYL